MVGKAGDSNEEAVGSGLLEMLQSEHPDALQTIMDELGDDESVITEFVTYFTKRQAKKEGREAIRVAAYLVQNDPKYTKAWTGLVEDATGRLNEGYDLSKAKKTARDERSAKRKLAREAAKNAEKEAVAS